jgi:microcystin-dependent protein
MPAVGDVKGYAGKTTPEGWLLCDGSYHKVSEHLPLFRIIGYSYGGEEDQFRVPKLETTPIRHVIKE